MKPNLTFKDLIFFKKLITPSVLTYIYWLSCVGIILFALISLFGSFAVFTFYGFGAWLTSFFMIIVYTFVLFVSTRVAFELIIIIFNINDNLKKIANQKTNTTESITNQGDQI